MKDHIIYCFDCKATYLVTSEEATACLCPECKSDYILCSSPNKTGKV